MTEELECALSQDKIEVLGNVRGFATPTPRKQGHSQGLAPSSSSPGEAKSGAALASPLRRLNPDPHPERAL